MGSSDLVQILVLVFHNWSPLSDDAPFRKIGTHKCLQNSRTTVIEKFFNTHKSRTLAAR